MSDVASSRVLVSVRLQLSRVAWDLLSRSSAAPRCSRTYAERFSTVEINYTFYRLPNEQLLWWAAQTPDHFAFTLKAPRRITHDAKLQRCEDLAQTFCRTASSLGPKLATLLFQLPPTFKKNTDVLREFTEVLPDGTERLSSSAIRRGSTPTSSTSCAAAILRSALPTARN